MAIAITCALVVVVAGVALVGGDRRVPRLLNDDHSGTLVLDSASALVNLELARTLWLDAGEEVFNIPERIYVTGDSTIVVPQPGDGTFRFYDADGKRVAPRVGVGDDITRFGPDLTSGLTGDTLWVWDPLARRVTFMDSRGRVLARERFRWAFAAPRDLARFPPVVAVSSIRLVRGGEFAVFVAADVPLAPSAWRYRRALLAFGESGLMHRVIGDFPVTPDLGAPTSIVAIDPHGARIAYVTTHPESDRAGRVRVVLLTTEGDTAFAREFRFATPPIADSAARARALYAPVSRVALTADGRSWLSVRNDDRGSLWIALDETGRPVARVELPRRADIAEAIGETLWVVLRDASAGAGIARYRVTQQLPIGQR